jgi:hypothetical protein
VLIFEKALCLLRERTYFCRVMKSQEVLIAHPQTEEQVSALKAFMQALTIKFEISDASSYDSDFVKKLLKSKTEADQGKVERVKKENLKGFLGV